MIKKITASVLGLCLAGTAVSAERYLCDGGIALTGNIDGIYAGSTITLSVIDADETFSSLQTNNNSGAIAYFGEFTATAENRYDLAFALAQSGEYRAYIGVASKAQPEEIEFEYINSAANSAAITALTSPGADIENILTVSRNDLGLFTKAYDAANLANAAAVLGASLPQGRAPAAEEMISLGEKSLLASALNNGNVTDIMTYSDVIEGMSISTYLGADIAPSVTGMMSRKNISSVSDFESKLKDAVLVSLANQATGAGMLKNALTRYASDYGLPLNKITAELCSAATSVRGFGSISDLTTYITNYNVPVLNIPQQGVSGGGGGGGGSFGGGSAGRNDNAFMGQTVTPPAGSDEPREEYSVFLDLDGVAWAKEAIIQLYNRGIVSGKTDTEYCPQDKVKREEFAKLITGAFNLNLVNEEIPFTDVTSEHWSYPYIRTAYLADITNGITGTLFGLGLDIKRQDLCVMVYKALQACDITLEPKNEAITFADSDRISDYAREAVDMLSRAGIVSGDDRGYFNPHSGATRAEAAVIIYRLIK